MTEHRIQIKWSHLDQFSKHFWFFVIILLHGVSITLLLLDKMPKNLNLHLNWFLSDIFLFKEVEVMVVSRESRFWFSLSVVLNLLFLFILCRSLPYLIVNVRFDCHCCNDYHRQHDNSLDCYCYHYCCYCDVAFRNIIPNFCNSLRLTISYRKRIKRSLFLSWL